MIMIESKLSEILKVLDLHNFIEIINSELIEEHKNLEPIEKISNSEKENLIDVIKRSDAKFFGKFIYEADESKLAFILYTITKSHFLTNGNKRTAAKIFISLFVLCNKDDSKIMKEIIKEETFLALAEKTIFIAESKPEQKEFVISDIEKWIAGVYK
jgi:prophage maintenance system killer protein